MSATSTVAAKEAEETKKGGRLKLVVIALVLVLVAAGGAWFFLLKPAGAEPAPEPGEIVPLDSTQINLAGDHYLRLGLALQLTTSAHEVDGSKALDAAIDLFSGQSLERISRAKERKHLKDELEAELEHAYHGDVMGVYFTEFVTQ